MSASNTFWLIAGITLIALPSGCSSNRARPSRPVIEFPDPAEVEALLEKPVQVELADENIDSGKDWILSGPLPDTIAATMAQPESAWETEFARMGTQANGAFILTHAMRCMAREMGLFAVQRKANPSLVLRQYALGMCGSSLPGVTLYLAPVQLEDGISDEELVRRWKDWLEDMRSGGFTEGGIFLARRKSRAILAIALGQEQAAVETMPAIRGSNDEWIVEGRVLDATEFVSTYATRGKYGVSVCEMDLSVHLPRFRAVCGVEPSDEQTLIEVIATPPKRVLGSTVARFVVRRDLEVKPVFRHEEYARSMDIESPESFTREVAARINQVRLEAGMRPLVLALDQSKMAARVAPHYFASLGGQSESKIADTVALGMLAGWQIPGMIRNARFMSSLAVSTANVSEWLSLALARPIGRLVLLDPKQELLALGPVVSRDPDALASIAIGYSLYHVRDHTADVVALFERISKARRRLNLPAPVPVGELGDDMLAALEHIVKGEATPSAALDHVLHRGTVELNRSMKGYLLETIDLDAVSLPDKLLRAPRLYLQIGITHHRPENASWAQYVVLIAYVHTEE